ncbi:MAG: S-layer homology domain-containing protein [Clostridia bacterium]|nr:S-layer homology domain-containing protein [Clostridia bacterium]
MKLTKRLLAYVVAVLILASCLSGAVPGQGTVAYAAPDNKEAIKGIINDYYRENVQDIFKRYGIFDEEKSKNSGDIEKKLSGLMQARAIDITGDGYDELFLMYLEKGDIKMEILTYEKGDVIKAWSTTVMWGGMLELYFYQDKSSGQYYWYYGVSRSIPSEMFFYKDGKYQKVGVTEVELSKPLEEFSTYHEEGEDYTKQMKKHFGLTPEKQGDYLLFEYRGDIVLSPADSYALCTQWELINEGTDTAKQENTKQNKTESQSSKADAFDSVKYYGDKTKCKMSEEMALAYTRAIEDDRNRANSISGESPHLMAALLDLAGDGMPILLTVTTSDTDKEILYDKSGTPLISVWTWNGKKAEKYNFLADMNLKYIDCISFYLNGGNSMIKVNEGDVYILSESSHGTLGYRVSNGQLSLKNHETVCVASVDRWEPQAAIGEYIPGVRCEKNEDGLFCASVEDLVYAKWVMGSSEQSGEHLYMRVVNGEFKPYKDYEEALEMIMEFDSQDGTELPFFTFDYDAGEDIWRVSENALTGHMNMTDALRNYAKFAGKPDYSYKEVYDSFADYDIEAIAKMIAKKYDGKITEIHKLSDDLYYIIIEIDGKVTGTVVAKNTKGGKSWRIVKSSDKYLSQEELEKEVNKDNRTPNIKIDYEKLDKGAAYIEEVLKDVDGTSLNPAAKDELIGFIGASISKTCSISVKSKNNVIVIPVNDVRDLSDSAVEMYNEYAKLIEKNSIVLDKPITIIVQLVVKNTNSKEPIQVGFTKDILEAMGDTDEMKLILGDSSCYIKVSKSSLQNIINTFGEIIVVIRDNGNGSYTIQFTDAKGNIIEQLKDPVSFALPAANEFCTIQAEYTGGTDNWGAQYDSANKTLIFNAFYSGTYTIIDKKIDIDDIDSLSEEDKKVIRFMVSKGFFELDGKMFNPDEGLTRYEFSKALVKMCFEADYSAKASFSDLEEDNPYYPYVASGATKGIIEGYDDGTFRGENKALREEVIALCSRTLAERKGYSEPSDPDLYLNFTDKDDIEWGHSEIALAVRQSIIDAGGMLYPQEAISRADAALILYRLFMLLYEVEPVAVNVNGASSDGSGTFPWAIAGGIGGAAVVGGGAALALLKRKRLAKKLIEKAVNPTSTDIPKE